MIIWKERPELGRHRLPRRPLKRWPKEVIHFEPGSMTGIRAFWENLRDWVGIDLYGLIDPDTQVREYHLEGFRARTKQLCHEMLNREPSRDQLDELIDPWLQDKLWERRQSRCEHQQWFAALFLSASREDLRGRAVSDLQPRVRPPLVPAIIPFVPVRNCKTWFPMHPFPRHTSVTKTSGRSPLPRVALPPGSARGVQKFHCLSGMRKQIKT
jgi:hypothetical protein